MLSKKFGCFGSQISVVLRSFQAKTATGTCVAMPLSVKSFLISHNCENSVSSSSFLNVVLTSPYTRTISFSATVAIIFPNSLEYFAEPRSIMFFCLELGFCLLYKLLSNKCPMQALIRLWRDILFLLRLFLLRLFIYCSTNNPFFTLSPLKAKPV